MRLIEHNLDKTLLERTVALAEKTGGFGARQLRAVLDSTPLFGAGRVEDTFNLLGHALRQLVGLAAQELDTSVDAIVADAGLLLVGHRSLKAALDLDWDEPQARTRGLIAVLGALDAVERWLDEQGIASDSQAQVQASRAAARQVRQQDVEMTAEGLPALRRGVSRDRRISIEDAAMRHGRKSRRVRIDGYKRHVLHDLDSGLVRAVGLTAANAPEASVTADLEIDLQAQRLGLVDLDELHLDRAYLSSRWVRERPASLAIYCKAWPVRNAGRFPKTAFTLDWQRRTIQCPNHIRLPFEPGGTLHYPAAVCASCPLQQRCTTSVRGRSVHIHPDERLLAELRERQHTPLGRAKLRERIAVEHTLAHVGHWQGRRARYCGQRKNLFDLRRCAVVDNLHVMSRLSVFAGEPRQDKKAA